jgi:ribosome-binding protein aMBF1 (putative translation factor)
MKRITRTRRLTYEEIEKDRQVREQIEYEKPEINAAIRRRMAEIRQGKAAGQGEKTLGQSIRAAREAAGVSQVDLATAANISQGYLSQLEQDEREPTLPIAARIARALGVSLDELAASVTSSS